MKERIKKAVIYVAMGLYTVVSLYPLVWMVFYSLKDNEEIFITNPFGPPLDPKWSNYVKAIEQFDILLFFKNSVIVSVLAIIIGLVAALMFSYVIARVRTKTTTTLNAIVMAGMFIPIQAIMTPLVVMVKKMGLTNTLWSLIVPYAAWSFPFAVMVLYGFYISLPIELEESAYIEGAGFVRTYVSIILPQMKSSISVLIIYQFMQHWNEFALASVLITNPKMMTLPRGIAGFFGSFSTDWGPVGACLVLASLPVVIIYLFFSNQVSEAMVHTGMKN